MRQILYGEQWIHPAAPQSVVDLFEKHGTIRKLKRGTELMHGGPDGEIFLLLKGLCVYRFWDWNDKEHALSLIIPNRTMGDIDGACCNVANVSAYVVRDGMALVLPYPLWHHYITENTTILEDTMRNIVQKQESHIEALLSCFTMDVDTRLRSFFHALIRAYYPPRMNDWNPIPIQLNTVILSKIVSSSRTSVSLALSAWTQKELLKKNGNMMVVHGKIFSDLFDWWDSKEQYKQRNQPKMRLP